MHQHIFVTYINPYQVYQNGTANHTRTNLCVCSTYLKAPLAPTSDTKQHCTIIKSGVRKPGASERPSHPTAHPRPAHAANSKPSPAVCSHLAQRRVEYESTDTKTHASPSPKTCNTSSKSASKSDSAGERDDAAAPSPPPPPANAPPALPLPLLARVRALTTLSL